MLSLRKLKLLKRRHHLSGLDEILPPLLLLLLIRGLLRWTVRSLLEWRERARWPPRLAEGVCG